MIAYILTLLTQWHGLCSLFAILAAVLQIRTWNITQACRISMSDSWTLFSTSCRYKHAFRLCYIKDWFTGQLVDIFSDNNIEYLTVTLTVLCGGTELDLIVVDKVALGVMPDNECVFQRARALLWVGAPKSHMTFPVGNVIDDSEMETMRLGSIK